MDSGSHNASPHTRADRNIRYGSIVSSRRRMSLGVSTAAGEAPDDAVDVGEGKTATFVEELIARLEQHGIRRELMEETNTEDDSCVLREEVEEAQQREPYCYTCVCCDKRLTPYSTRAATMAMLQDIHFHCGTAKHRKSVFLMEDEESLLTLKRTPQVEHPEHYIRVYVNGVPLLISRNPGGGDLFYPLPHEVDLPVAQRVKLREAPNRSTSATESKRKLSLWPPSQTESFWYYPMQTLSSHSYQFLTLNPSFIVRQDLNEKKQALIAERIPLEEYNSAPLVAEPSHAVQIACLCLKRRRLEDVLPNAATGVSLDCDRNHHFAYSQTVLCEDVTDYPALERGSSNKDIDRYLVSDGDCFRLVYTTELSCGQLKMAADMSHETTEPLHSARDGGSPIETGVEEQVLVPELTVELLRRYFPLDNAIRTSSVDYYGHHVSYFTADSGEKSKEIPSPPNSSH